MEIASRIVTLQLAQTFVISRESQDEAEVVQVEVMCDGSSGFGEAAPIARYDESAASAQAWLDGVELGGGEGLDLERVRAVRAARSPPLMADVNEYWSLDEALEYLPQMELEYCEQPLPASDADGPELKRRSPLPIYVDEDCHTLADVAGCVTIAHGVNIKLAKSGGIREGVRIAHAARALGLGVMLGCMIESGLGIAAGAAIASLCDHVDLDGNLLIAHDPWPGVELVDGVQVPSDEPAYDPTTALVGVATQGGRFPPAWRKLLEQCVRVGLDVENGLHEYLSDDAGLVDLAAGHGVELRDLRRPPPGLDVPTGENLEL